MGFLVYCLLPEIQCNVYLKQGLINELSLVDQISALYCVVFGLASLLAIGISSLFENFFVNEYHKKFQVGCDIFGFTIIAFVLVFFFTNGVFLVIWKKPEQDEDPIIKEINQRIIDQMPYQDVKDLFGLQINPTE
eukprot:CAMPEP_0202966266 /NCGR_PEP_ID=MMETSP1396-20130829/10601_1 /ASSEMBLY_ACC=CAM_ASM_000872 /TAXON_ID= /ORGANISM="Pseudokeronopsis sp., Strain Brazil" /LENGTH=134 /DNA_ID=CAMNT_0049689919 /DNA_START=1233 /DNA_END=1637 /DNA_ORIENTATION=+